MPKVDKERLRAKLVDGIDRALYRPWLAGLDAESQAFLKACRSAVIVDDVIVEKILPYVGPYSEVTMPTKKLTAQQVAAIDWAALFAKLPALANLIAEIIEILARTQAGPKAATTPTGHCPCEVHEKCHVSLEALATAVVAALELHDAIECCDEV